MLQNNNTAFKTGDQEGLQADQGSLWGRGGKHVISLDFNKDLIQINFLDLNS